MNCFEIVKRKRMKVRSCISIEYFWDRMELKENLRTALKNKAKGRGIVYSMINSFTNSQLVF